MRFSTRNWRSHATDLSFWNHPNLKLSLAIRPRRNESSATILVLFHVRVSGHTWPPLVVDRLTGTASHPRWFSFISTMLDAGFPYHVARGIEGLTRYRTRNVPAHTVATAADANSPSWRLQLIVVSSRDRVYTCTRVHSWNEAGKPETSKRTPSWNYVLSVLNEGWPDRCRIRNSPGVHSIFADATCARFLFFDFHANRNACNRFCNFYLVVKVGTMGIMHAARCRINIADDTFSFCHALLIESKHRRLAQLRVSMVRLCFVLWNVSAD